MNVRKWHQSEISIAINDESQEFKVWWVSILHIYHSISWWNPGERIFKIGEHLAKLQAKWLTVSYTPFVLHFCPERCRSHQVSWITCVLQTETVIKRDMLIGRLVWVNYQEISNCCRPVLTYWLTPSVTDWLLIMYGILPRQLFCVAAVLYSGSWDFFYMADVNNFLLVN